MKKLILIIFVIYTNLCISQNIGAVYYPSIDKVIPVNYNCSRKVEYVKDNPVFVTIYISSSNDGFNYPYIKTMVYHFKSIKTIIATSVLVFEDSETKLNEETFFYTNLNLKKYHSKQVPYNISFYFNNSEFKYVELSTMYLGYSKDGYKQYLAVNIKK